MQARSFIGVFLPQAIPTPFGSYGLLQIRRSRGPSWNVVTGSITRFSFAFGPQRHDITIAYCCDNSPRHQELWIGPVEVDGIACMHRSIDGVGVW